jgi:hypothetical protein
MEKFSGGSDEGVIVFYASLQGITRFGHELRFLPAFMSSYEGDSRLRGNDGTSEGCSASSDSRTNQML